MSFSEHMEINGNISRAKKIMKYSRIVVVISRKQRWLREIIK